MEIPMHMAERPMVGAVLGPAGKSLIVRTVMGTAGIIVKLSVPGMVTLVTVVVAVG